jgi:hypothetical protein
VTVIIAVDDNEANLADKYVSLLQYGSEATTKLTLNGYPFQARNHPEHRTRGLFL